MTGFKFIDKNKEFTAVFLPGWAADHRIFGKLTEEFNCILPLEIQISDLYHVLASEVAKHKKTVLVGWSLGGVLGAEFMLRYPELIGFAAFIGVKPVYPAEEIMKMKDHFKKDKAGYLETFYKLCLKGHPDEDREWFGEKLKDEYISKLNAEKLLSGLDCLAGARFPIAGLKAHQGKIAFFHGEQDAVIKKKETYALREHFLEDRFVDIRDTGHMAFLSNVFFREMHERIR